MIFLSLRITTSAPALPLLQSGRSAWLLPWHEIAARSESILQADSFAFARLPWIKTSQGFDLTREQDGPIWAFAAKHDFKIVSKDADFLHLALLRGHPPRQLLNEGTRTAFAVRRTNHQEVHSRFGFVGTGH